jgi:hypothetical protein
MPKHVPNEKGLTVPDAESLDAFLANAKTVWCAAHGVEMRPPGRPREEVRLWKALEAAQDELIDNEWRCPPMGSREEEEAEIARLRKILNNDTKMVALLKAWLKGHGDHVHNEDTLKKYVKLRRLKRRAVASYTPQEERWLAKNDRERWTRHLVVMKGLAELYSVRRQIDAAAKEARESSPRERKLTKEENRQFKLFQDKRWRRAAVAKK